MEAIAPGVHVLEVADGAFVDELPDIVEIGIKVALCTALGGQLVLILHVGVANHASLFHTVGQRLFTVDMQPPVHCPNGNKGVVMVRRANDYCIEVFLVQALAPILVLLGLRELLGGRGERLGIDVAEGDDVFFFQHVEMGGGPPPAANKSDIQPISGAVLPEERTAGKKHEPRASSGGGGEKFTTIWSSRAIHNFGK